MNFNEEKESFGFEPENVRNTFDYNDLSGLGESNYENEDLFSSEVESDNETTDFVPFTPQTIPSINENLGFNLEVPIQTLEQQKPQEEQVNTVTNIDTNNIFEMPNSMVQNNVQPVVEQPVVEGNQVQVDEVESTPVVPETPVMQQVPEVFGEMPQQAEPQAVDLPVTEENQTPVAEVENAPVMQEAPEVFGEMPRQVEPQAVDLPVTEENQTPVVEEQLSVPIVSNVEVKEEIPSMEKQDLFGDTPITELNKLTEFEDDKVEPTNIKALFERVGVNVKEASDIFRKNSEMKEKIDTRFEELKKLQSEVGKVKQAQYEEINAYKEEVLSKLTEKKEEIEKRLNKLKEFQTSLEKEKEEFEKYKKQEKEEIERVQREVQSAYDSRRDELNHIEDVLRKQKDALDEERSQLSLDRIQYESDKNELANNLLKFNEIVGSFTNGMDKINKE